MSSEKHYELGLEIQFKFWKNQSQQKRKDFEERLLEHLEETARNYKSNGCGVKSISIKKGSIVDRPWTTHFGSLYCLMNPVKDVIVYQGGPGHDGEKEFLQGLQNRLYEDAKKFKVFSRIKKMETINHGLSVRHFRIAII